MNTGKNEAVSAHPVPAAGWMPFAIPGGWAHLARDYLSAISGAVGRLVFSLAYFVLLANTLSISDFGLFATSSAAGVMLSRIVALGFSSPLYRAATMRPRLIGLYSGGYLLLGLVSLPLLAAASFAVFLLFFASNLALGIFATIIVAEALFWRSTEVVVIVNNGMNRFGRAAILVIIGTLLRALAAAAFVWWPVHTIGAWAWFYLAANALALAVALAFFYPRRRLRFSLPVYRRRMADSLAVSGAEVLFYLQMELDKLFVLALGGPHLAGIYAIIMRLVDLTAIPVRTFNMMLVQALMRGAGALRNLKRKIAFEAGIFAVSLAGLLALAVILHFFPRALGANVAEAAPLVVLALLVPGLRNLAEYHAELLYARGRTGLRAINLALLGGVKAVMLAWALTSFQSTDELVWSLNGVFAAIYLASLPLTYSALRLPSRAM